MSARTSLSAPEFAPLDDTETLVRRNVANGDVMIVGHAARQMKRRGITFDAVLASIASAEVIEHYPHDNEGPAILMLLWDAGAPLHLVWRIEAATAGPAVLVTAYRPNPQDWTHDFRHRVRAV